MNEPDPVLRPERVLETLARHDVRYILIGALAATLHGSPLRTNDADICPDPARDNLERLAAALRALEARVWSNAAPEGIAFSCDAATLAQAQIWNLVTRYGRVDISFTPSGTTGYHDLARSAATFDIDGVHVRAASLLDVIRSKEAAARPKDLAQLPTLRRLLERLEEGDASRGE